jgi:putative ABC transport system permease protein
VFFKFIIKALKYRRQRLLLASSALAVAAALATVLFGIYGSVERHLREQFATYGANLLAVPNNGASLPIAIAKTAENQGAEVAPFQISTARIGTTTVPVAAYNPEKAAPLTTYWHVNGTRQLNQNECLAGENLAARLNLKMGSFFRMDSTDCTLRGIVSTGGAEDNEILIPHLTGETASFIEMRVPGEKLDAIRKTLTAQYPTVDFRAIRAVADTESNVVLKIRASLFLLTLLILIITTLCVSGNFTEMVIERAKEIAILKSLGATEPKIAAFFVSESAALAVAATLAGYLAGIFAAAGIARNIFGGVFHLQADWRVFGGVALVMLIVATVATAIAASRIWTIEPAIILRGE